MQPQFMNTCINRFPIDEHDPKRNKKVEISIEVYIPNPTHPNEWLCIASFFGDNVFDFLNIPAGLPMAVYFGDKWVELTPMPVMA